MFGMIQKNQFSEQMEDMFKSTGASNLASPNDANQILSSARASMPPDILNHITEALTTFDCSYVYLGNFPRSGRLFARVFHAE
jgi:hypothetical protein